MIPRLYVKNFIDPHSLLTLPSPQSHYLKNVLRLNIDDSVHVFNETIGEWLGTISKIAKHEITLTPQHSVRPPVITFPLWLAFAPLKKEAMDWVVEKATELGVSHLQPIITERTNTQRLNLERMYIHSCEAAQQCERLGPAEIMPLISLEVFMQTFHHSIFVCQERSRAEPVAKTFSALPSFTQAALMIGPEGGWSDKETSFLQAYKNIHFINLGPRILRAETACISALSCFQALVGDWQGHENEVMIHRD